MSIGMKAPSKFWATGRRSLVREEAADRRRDEFLAVLAHELRNPLAPIFNALALLEDESIPTDAQRKAHRIIGRQVRTLSRLIDDLLDVSRITRGRIQLRKATLPLQGILLDALQSSQPLFGARGQKVLSEIEPESVFVDCDPLRIEQVFVNLLSNAAKYGGDRGIIQVQLCSDHGTALVRVKDSGAGIAPEMLPNIFELFTHADKSLERSQEGLGVGLALVRNLVELHGGSVDTFSEGLGKGSEFNVRLPLVNRPSMMQPFMNGIRRPAKTSKPLRVLIVDDNVDAADSLEDLLKLVGHDVTTVHSGPESVDAAKQYNPDVLLLDIALPGLDGYQIAERLRTTPETKDIILVATTGYDQDEDRQRAMQSGFDYHLAKPLDSHVLSEILLSIAERKSPGTPPHMPASLDPEEDLRG